MNQYIYIYGNKQAYFISCDNAVFMQNRFVFSNYDGAVLIPV